MRIRRDRKALRTLGSLLGAAFCLLGLFALLRMPAGEGAGPTLGAGVTFLAAGVAAIWASLTVTDPGRIW
jgi:hypothetical protein